MPDPLIARVRSGDREAYADVVEVHQDMLVGWASYLLPDRELAEEVAHRTFIRAYEQLDTFDDSRDFGIWLRAICRSLAQGELTRLRRERHNRENAREHLRQLVLLATPLPEGDGDRLDALRRCLEGLDGPLRDLVHARYAENRPVAETASHLGRTVTWVTTTLGRVRERLRDCVERRLAGVTP
jgi:RNA polymerase sigma-70 factor, ECF subfamily